MIVAIDVEVVFETLDDFRADDGPFDPGTVQVVLGAGGKYKLMIDDGYRAATAFVTPEQLQSLTEA